VIDLELSSDWKKPSRVKMASNQDGNQMLSTMGRNEKKIDNQQ
jgi:hypothetical protein